MEPTTREIILKGKDGTVTKTLVVKELSALEAMNADRIAGMTVNGTAVRAFFGIVSVNGEPVVPVMNEATLNALVSQFTMREYDSLVTQYAEAYILDEEALKTLEKTRGPRSS